MHSVSIKAAAAVVSACVALSVQAELDCTPLDLSGLSTVSITAGSFSMTGNGGPLPGGRWELVGMRTFGSPLPVSGNGRGVLELDAVDPVSGSGRLALDIQIQSPFEFSLSEAGGGLYNTAGSLLAFENLCGDGDLLLGDAQYTVDVSGPEPELLTYGQLQLGTPPLSFTLNIEARFRLVEPRSGVDPVFEDRFD